MGRLLVAANSLLGGLGLGLSFGYFLFVVASFHPKGSAVADLMVGPQPDQLGFGFALVILPYACLMLHLWGRVRLANHLVDTGDPEVARRYAERRLKTGLLRSRRESLANRTALMRLAMRAGDYDAVEQLRADAVLPKPPRFGAMPDEVVAFHRWSLEAALRREDLIAARELVERVWPIPAATPQVAAFAACAAELAVRNNAHDEFEEWVARAEFADRTNPRLAVARILAAQRFDREAPEESHAELWLEDVPGARAEVEAVFASLSGQDVRQVTVENADSRSKHVVEALAVASD